MSPRLSQSNHFDTWLALSVVDYDYVYLKNLKNQLIPKIDQKQLNFTMMRNVTVFGQAKLSGKSYKTFTFILKKGQNPDLPVIEDK